MAYRLGRLSPPRLQDDDSQRQELHESLLQTSDFNSLAHSDVPIDEVQRWHERTDCKKYQFTTSRYLECSRACSGSPEQTSKITTILIPPYLRSSSLYCSLLACRERAEFSERELWNRHTFVKHARDIQPWSQSRVLL